MPRYCFKCPICGNESEQFRSMEDRNMPATCVSCGELMGRDLLSEHSNVRGDYNHPITSVSMAINSLDVDEHRRKYPGVDLHVDTPGQTAYPILRSRSQKLKYLRARGWQER